MKRKIGIVLLLVFSLMISGCKEEKTPKKEESQSKVTVKEKNVIKEQTVSGLKFKNVSMVVNEDITTLKIDVENTTKSDIEVEEIIIDVKDKNGKTITSLTGYVGGIVKAKETKKIINTSDIDLSKANSIEYKLK